MGADMQASLLAEVAQSNARLRYIGAELKRLQPKTEGSVTLLFRSCGKACHGCPHPSWRVWRKRYRGDHYLWLAHRIDHPLKSLARAGRFAENYPQVRALVEEALRIQKRRAELLKELRRVQRLLT
jgi:hypothetical protein